MEGDPSESWTSPRSSTRLTCGQVKRVARHSGVADVWYNLKGNIQHAVSNSEGYAALDSKAPAVRPPPVFGQER